MDQVVAAIKSVFNPIRSLYNQAFNANKYAAGIGLSVIITTGLFFVMVVLISLGDSGMKEDTSVKLADIVMPERQIDTFMTEVEKPEKPEEQPEDIAQPELDLQPLTGIDVSIAKPKANFKAGAQERGTEGFSIVSFTITESGTVEDAKAIEGYCGDPEGPEEEMRPCTLFNSASARAALKLKYKPKIVDGKATSVEGVLHRFTFIMADQE
jgi:protein TonB